MFFLFVDNGLFVFVLLFNKFWIGFLNINLLFKNFGDNVICVKNEFGFCYLEMVIFVYYLL